MTHASLPNHPRSRPWVYVIALLGLFALFAGVTMSGRDLAQMGAARSSVGAALLALAFGAAAPWFWLGLAGAAVWTVVWLGIESASRPGERDLAARKAYLYLGQGAAAAALAWQASRSFGLLLSGTDPAAALSAAVGSAVAVLFWAFLRWIAVRDGDFGRETGAAAGWRRVYSYSMAALGLILLANGVAGLIAGLISPAASPGLSQSAADTLVGVLVLAVIWVRVHRLVVAASDVGAEVNALSRKLFLCVGSALAVFAALAGLFRVVRDVLSGFVAAPSTSAAELPTALGLLAVGVLAWLLLEIAIRSDACRAPEDRVAVTVWRAARYGMAAVALAAFLVGLTELLRIIVVAALGAAPTDQLAQAATRARFVQAAALALVGAPAWWGYWWPGRQQSRAPGYESREETNSVPRRIYLYGVILASAVTFFFSTGMGILRGLEGHSLAAGVSWLPSGVIALISLVGHLRVLQSDERATSGARQVGAAASEEPAPAPIDTGESAPPSEAAPPLSFLRATLPPAPTAAAQPCILVVDGGDGALGASLAAALAAAFPQAVIWPLGLNAAASAAMSAALGASWPATPPDAPARAALIVGPSDIAVPGAANGQVSAALSAAVMASPARKLLLPPRDPALRWVAAPDWPDERWVENAVIEAVNFLSGAA